MGHTIKTAKDSVKKLAFGASDQPLPEWAFLTDFNPKTGIERFLKTSLWNFSVFLLLLPPKTSNI
jgi:hypothetical protein